MIVDVFRDEGGVTTTGMVVSLLLSLALVFSSAQVYRVSSASAAVREVADAAALAAENEIAEFMVAVRVCDAVVLSLSLLGVVVYGASVVAMCVPSGAAVSAKLVDLGGKVVSARDGFAERATSGLNALQKALPFLCAAQAASIAKANDGGAGGSSYYAAALLVPSAGEEIALDVEGRTGDLGERIEGDADSIREAAAQAEEKALEAQEAKLRGFESDCGRDPSYCLYERAESLAGLAPGQNPRYDNVDAWSFAVPLERARSYYAARLAREEPESDGVEDQARSALRKRFYAYASEELARGYVIDEPDRFDASFPRLFSNTDELRETALYDESVYPVTRAEDGACVMHAWSGCPGASGYAEVGSLRRLEELSDEFRTCDRCGFTLASVGNIAASSTSIDNGFEHYYRAVVQAAEEYERAREQLDPATLEVKGTVGGLMEECAEIAEGVKGSRIDASPPGRYGAVALVVDAGRVQADAGFASSFVRGGHVLGARRGVCRDACRGRVRKLVFGSLVSSRRVRGGCGGCGRRGQDRARMLVRLASSVLRRAGGAWRGGAIDPRSASPLERERLGRLGRAAFGRRHGGRGPSACRTCLSQARARQLGPCRLIRGGFVLRFIRRGQGARIVRFGVVDGSVHRAGRRCGGRGVFSG